MAIQKTKEIKKETSAEVSNSYKFDLTDTASPLQPPGLPLHILHHNIMNLA